MAITKVYAKNHRLDVAIKYVLNGDKTDNQVLTARINCDPGWEYQQMMDTKREVGKTGGRLAYHIIQSFKPGEITPEQALEIGKEFAEKYLSDYEVVIGTHIDKGHIHNHILYNSVSVRTGKKEHFDRNGYYAKIRAKSDELCRKHGLSVIKDEGEPIKASGYVEWLRKSRGEPTFRSMLEADLRDAIEDANNLGHFFMIMEHKGYEIKHGNRLSFRLRGQERFMCPGRKNPLFTEDGILAAIEKNLDDVEAGLKPVVVYRPVYEPYRKHPKYTGFLALYVHYLYILGKIEKREYPPRMTPQMRKDVMRFEQLREQFKFMRENDISTEDDMSAYQVKEEEKLTGLIKQRTVLNARKKRRRKLYTALSDAEMLSDAENASERGVPGEDEAIRRYADAVSALEKSGIDRETLKQENIKLYNQLSEINREIRTVRKKLKMCAEISERTPKIEQDIQKTVPERRKKQETLTK